MPAASDRKTLSHDRIVEVASRAVRRSGCDGVGVAAVMNEAGLTHGGFYAHFESRTALLAEAVRRAGRDSAAALGEGAGQAEAAGSSAFRALVDTYLHRSRLAGAERGCCVAALASELPRQPGAVRAAGRRSVLELVEAVRGRLPQGVDSSEAEVIVATMVGSLQLARTLGGRRGERWLATTRQSLIDRYDGPGAGGCFPPANHVRRKI